MSCAFTRSHRSKRCQTAIRWLAAGALALAWLGSASASAQVRNDIVPDTWQGDVLRPKPDMHGLEKLRFVTDSDYPPFHYFDEVGALTGFNVDLAKAICESLEVECEIKDVDWREIYTSLDRAEADAAIGPGPHRLAMLGGLRQGAPIVI